MTTRIRLSLLLLLLLSAGCTKSKSKEAACRMQCQCLLISAAKHRVDTPLTQNTCEAACVRAVSDVALHCLNRSNTCEAYNVCMQR